MRRDDTELNLYEDTTMSLKTNTQNQHEPPEMYGERKRQKHFFPTVHKARQQGRQWAKKDIQ